MERAPQFNDILLYHFTEGVQIKNSILHKTPFKTPIVIKI